MYRYTLFTIILLVLLRLAIGWHFLFEGVWKYKQESWSSEPYLRESQGPFAGSFRDLAGDPVLQRMDVALTNVEGDDAGAGSLPPRLAQEWQAYFDTFVATYNLDAEQKKKAQEAFDHQQRETLFWLRGVKPLSKVSPNGSIEVRLMSPGRLESYTKKLDYLNEVERGELSTFGPKVEARVKELKADIARLRSDLLADLEVETNRMKSSLNSVLTDEQRKIAMPATIKPGWKSWNRLQWSDAITLYGLIIVGGLLLLGLFTRPACIVGAAFLLLFYLSMMPFSTLPESARTEGHYVYVSKNVIEMLALLALAGTPTGRWFGLDYFLRRKKKEVEPASTPSEPPVRRPADGDVTQEIVFTQVPHEGPAVPVTSAQAPNSPEASHGD